MIDTPEVLPRVLAHDPPLVNRRVAQEAVTHDWCAGKIKPVKTMPFLKDHEGVPHKHADSSDSTNNAPEYRSRAHEISQPLESDTLAGRCNSSEF